MPESSTSRTSVGPMANKMNEMASPKELRNSCFGIAKVCSSSLFCNIAYDLGCLYFFGAALALIVAAFGGLLFLDNETALVSILCTTSSYCTASSWIQIISVYW